MIKRLLAFLYAFIFTFFPFAGFSQIYISTTGADTNDGSITAPKATFHAALRQARELRRLNDPLVKNGLHIIAKGGTYFIDEPLFIRPEDAGTADSPTWIEAAPGEEPVISGGINISGWTKASPGIAGISAKAKGELWVARVPETGGTIAGFRQLWVNDHKAIRAKDFNGDSMSRILSWNKKEQSCWIPTPAVASLREMGGVEMFIHQWWAIAILRVKRMETNGDSTKLYFHQPESRIQSEHPWPAPWLSNETGNSAFYLTNALQFLDEPGEWWLDVANRTVYYWPRPSENLQTATVIAPLLETLVQISGTPGHRVSNIYFKGISFSHTSWLRPSLYGHVPHQAGMYMLDAYKLKPAGTPGKQSLENQAWVGRPPAAVAVSFADKTRFENCSFRHLASTGLDYHKGVQDNVIEGNLFKDIGGTAILAGVFSDEATEIHLPYRPADEGKMCDKIRVVNNLVTNATNEDWSCVGIGLGYTKNSIVAHNEIEEVSYSGISMGWGWSAAPNAMKKNVVTKNKIHHYGKHNYDCAGIYTLGAQAGSFISENYIDSIYKAPYAHLPTHWFYLYTDEGSAHFTVQDNWTPSQKYLQNANGPGNVWHNNGPQVSERIKQEAGLQRPFQILTREKSPRLNRQPINKERNEVIELVVNEGDVLDLVKLKTILRQNNMDTAAIYQWQNHYVLYGKVPDITVMQARLQNNFRRVTVKVFHDLFYEFNRDQCRDGSTTQEWDHVLLTTNLVADNNLQQEYLTYHATQFQKWPEVSKGFCDANFQQVLLFKNGRQLVLVISIPKGESLERLNPKTTEYNPRVNEWNKIMSKYQEGIQGTKKGETWVFLNQLVP